MTFLGMNIDQASEQVTRFSTGEQRLEALTDGLGATVASSADFWRGPDADAFRAAWESTSTGLRTAGQDLESRGTKLTQHQDEQTTASESDGQSAGAGPDGPSTGSGSDGPSAADGPVDKTNGPGDEAYYGEVDPEVAEHWRSMDPEDREAVARAIVEEQLERYGVEGVPIDFNLSDANGWWEFTQEDGHTISINGEALENPRLLHTLAHEARHAAQWEAVQDTESDVWDWLPWTESPDDAYERLEDEHGFTREEIDSWRDHWNTPKDEQDPYLDQSVEVDARNGGAEYSEGLTMEDLERYKEEAGVS